ncbi:MAG: NUDIX hydrolase [Thermaerobacter sp.]|nr:NUDIX hydrolase [Bacillota bacterium]REJ38415.1 MAG: NUDIX hydrolase [Bacillota bacterium]
MHVDAEAVARLEAAYGRPALLTVEQSISRDEAGIVQRSLDRGRRHDMTLFIFDPAGRLALIRKPFHPPGVYRAPSGGVRPGEAPDQGALREGYEETGLRARLHRYVLRVDALFLPPDGQILSWQSHVFTAFCPEPPPHPRPVDTEEIAEVRWATLEELQGPVRRALLESGRGLLRYRASLTDAVAALLHLHPDWRPGGGCR